MREEELFALPFHEYMARRTKFAVDKAQEYNYADLCSPEAIAMLQTIWAKNYWFNKNEGVAE